jgi:hypothetical protein
MATTLSACPNLNHRRANAPVRCCPICGEIVNDEISVKQCADEIHAKRRMQQSKYCVDCGEQLIK